MEPVEQAFEKSQQGKFPRDFEFMGRRFILHKGVFSPEVFHGSRVYKPLLPIKQGQSMLDMGCGTGVIGIGACIDKKLSRVVCCDINPDAVKNCHANVVLHGLQDKVSVLLSDVFSGIDKNEKFDLLFWNAPYVDYDYKDMNMLQRSAYDPDYKQIKRFILDGQNHLKPNGKIVLGFSSDKFPLEWAKAKINEIGYDANVLARVKDDLGFNQELLDIAKID